ncbi:MAG: DUF3052 domain-containing protein [Actinobacteria bacterium]|nr:DUF3052 domain-containing protein [Actinomycetota bacterium]
MAPHDVAAGSGTPLAKKLGIVGGASEVVFTVRHAPPGFAEALGDIGDAVWQQSLLAPLDVVIAFHTTRARLAAEWPRLTEPLQPDGAVWVAWPKQTSGVPTDLTEQALRDQILPTGWVDNKVCAIDDQWSGLRFVLRKTLRRPKDNARRR